MAEERILRIRLTLGELASIRHLAVDYECMPIRRRDDGMIEMEALASESTVAKLRRTKRRDLFVEVLADRAHEAAEAMRLVSRTNRYANGALPSGLGKRRG